MATIQGFYQIRPRHKPNYCVRYWRSGSPVLDASSYLEDNTTTWMIFQPSDSNSNYVQLVSATRDISIENEALFSKLAESDPLNCTYNVYILNNIYSTVPTIVATGLETSYNSTSLDAFIMTQVGVAEINKHIYPLVVFKHCYTGKYLDYSKAMSNLNNSLTLETSGSTICQEFILENSSPYYDQLVAPSEIGLSFMPGISAFPSQYWRLYDVLYWYWRDSTNTINAGDSHQYRERDLTCNNSGTWTYGSWTDYTSINSTNWKQLADKRWLKNPTTIPSCSTSIKEVGKQIEMNTNRSLTVFDKTFLFNGATASQTVYFSKCPTLTKDGLSWTPDGLKVNFTSDYFGQGSMKLRFTSIKSDSGELLSKNYDVTIVQDTTITIPTSYLKRQPKDGESLTLTIRLDTDMYAPSNYYKTLKDTVTYDAGNVGITPVVTELDGLRYKIDVNFSSQAKAWMNVGGKNIPIEGTFSDNHTIFEVLAPFCTEYGIFVSYENADKTQWGTAYIDMPTVNIRAHAFTWDGGSVVIWLNKDTALTESFTFEPTATTHTLAGRSHDVVTYLSNAGGNKNYTSVTGDVKGYIVPNLETYGTTRESIEAMVEQGHVLYRAPYGRVCNVAVTGADVTTDKGITEVSVSIVEEDI